MAGHAGPLGDVAAGPRRIQLVVGQVLACGARGGQLAAAAGRGRGRGAACRPQRKRQTGAVARVQRQLLHFRREAGRPSRNLVAAGEERHGPKAAGLRVHHVQHPPVHVPDVHAGRRERGFGRDRAGHGRRVGHLGSDRGAPRRGARRAACREHDNRRRQPPRDQGCPHDGPPSGGCSRPLRSRSTLRSAIIPLPATTDAEPDARCPQ